MTLATLEQDHSLCGFIETHAEPRLSKPWAPDDIVERRRQPRLEPLEPLTLRLDVMGEIWSARVHDVSATSACLQLDRELAGRLADGQPASLWVEPNQGAPVQFEGRLRFLSTDAGHPSPQLTSMSFTCGPATGAAAG
ncbi:MAG: PilZ domain-containing protein [bacterium]|nr:PilZ domain-containing protein [bacterium]